MEEIIASSQRIQPLEDNFSNKALVNDENDLSQIQPIDEVQDQAKFSQLMEQNSQLSAQANATTSRVTPIEEAAKLGGSLSVDDARNLSASLTEFKNRQRARLEHIIDKVNNNSQVQMRPSVERHLDMRMKNLDSQINEISNQFNLKKVAPPESGNKAFNASLQLEKNELLKPVEKFFNFIARGENQLYSIENELNSAIGDGSEIPNPAVMLKLQLKMTHVSQQIELFTSILNKGLESSKTVFNTQI